MDRINYLSLEQISEFFADQTVAIVGSAPSVLENEIGLIDSHDIIVRVNNYKLSNHAGHKIDVHYSFYGNSVRKKKQELIQDGVILCMNKCPNDKPINSEWHIKNKKSFGVDFRNIHANRNHFWFCDTYIPDTNRFLHFFNMMNKRIPTTGFQCILEILDTPAKSIYLTGFDFFDSNMHNVNERWRKGDPNDPIRHDNEAEKNYIMNLSNDRLLLDGHLNKMKDRFFDTVNT
jgi:hypothetical protein